MSKVLWMLADNRRGSVNQALGVIDALDKNNFDVIEKKIEYNCLASLPNCLRGRSLLGITAESRRQLTAPYPDMVLSVSRRTAPVARYIKKKSPQTKLIQLMHPGNSCLEDFDLIIVPEHDRNKKSAHGTHYIIGCPHRVTKDYLDQARSRWQEEFSDLPRPLTAVIIGGAIKGGVFSRENAEMLGSAIKKLKQKIGGSLLLTTSRRTGAEAQNIILQQLNSIPQYTYLWGDTKENPYAGFLACADNIIVTADSVSMCCEATASGKPVFLFTGKDWLTPKHMRFAQSLCNGGYAVMIDDDKADKFFPQKHINAAAEVAELIERL